MPWYGNQYECSFAKKTFNNKVSITLDMENPFVNLFVPNAPFLYPLQGEIG